LYREVAWFCKAGDVESSGTFALRVLFWPAGHLAKKHHAAFGRGRKRQDKKQPGMLRDSDSMSF